MKELTAFIVSLVFLSSLPLGAVHAQESQVTVEVNPNLELFAVVYILAFNGSDPFIVAPQDYIQDVLTYFAPYRNSEAVTLMKDIMPQSFPYYIRDRSIVSFAGDLVNMPYLGNMREEDPLLTGLYQQLVKFAKESNFIQFYNAHKETYEKAAKPFREVLPDEIPQKFVEFFGYSYTSYKVELSYSLWIHPHSEYSADSAICVMTAQGDPLRQGMVIIHELSLIHI